jgi:hypothetical protein
MTIAEDSIVKLKIEDFNGMNLMEAHAHVRTILTQIKLSGYGASGIDVLFNDDSALCVYSRTIKIIRPDRLLERHAKLQAWRKTKESKL